MFVFCGHHSIPLDLLPIRMPPWLFLFLLFSPHFSFFSITLLCDVYFPYVIPRRPHPHIIPIIFSPLLLNFIFPIPPFHFFHIQKRKEKKLIIFWSTK